MNIQSAVNSKTAEERATKLQNLQLKSKFLIDTVNLADSLSEDNKIAGMALKRNAFANYFNAMNNLGLGKDVIARLEDIPESSLEEIKGMDLDPDTFDQEDYENYLELSKVLYDDKIEHNTAKFQSKSGLFTSDSLNILKTNKIYKKDIN
jgi:hypothetical protein